MKSTWLRLVLNLSSLIEESNRRGRPREEGGRARSEVHSNQRRLAKVQGKETFSEETLPQELPDWNQSQLLTARGTASGAGRGCGFSAKPSNVWLFVTVT